MTYSLSRLLTVSLIILGALLPAQARKPVIFTIGDSTMANKKLDGQNPERGWGQMLPGFLTDNIEVVNCAVNGRSSRSFIGEQRWEKVLPQMQPGDYLFIQFGHNDQKPDSVRHTEPFGEYSDNLRRYVREAREKGVKPLILSSIVRRQFDSAGHLKDTHGDYPEAARRVAEEMGVPFVDMTALSTAYVDSLGPELSKGYYMHVAKGTVPLCPEGKQDNTHLNMRGARAMADMAVRAIAEVMPELAPYIRHYDYVVAKDGSGDFFTVQEAINAVPDLRGKNRTTILVREGVYKEKIVVPTTKINLSLIGQGNVTLTYDDYASRKNAFGEEIGTAGSSSFYVYAPDFYAENITFENAAGPVGQAVACFVGGDRAAFRNCRFLGNQDTLYTWCPGRQYYKDCYLEGTVDFIFGRSTAVFDGCRIHAKRRGYLTAPSTDKGARCGYLFLDCSLTADEGVDRVFLSRPWRDYAHAVFARCEMGAHIHPEGWHNWNKPEREKTVTYAEYANYGPGADTSARVRFGKQLKNLDKYDKYVILAGNDGWNPVDTDFTASANATAVKYP